MKRGLWFLVILLGLGGCKYRLQCRFSTRQARIERMISRIDTLIVDPAVRTYLHQSPFYRLRLQASEDVLPRVRLQIQGRSLRVTNDVYCLVLHSGSTARLDLYAPDLKVIIANSDLPVSSVDTLRYGHLKLISENATVGENNITDFDLLVHNQSLNIVANGTSIFRLHGQTEKLNVGFYGVNPAFYGQTFRSRRVYFYQRSGGDMHFYPLDRIDGDVYGYGNVYIHHRPDTVNIRMHYAGKVIWAD